jgi:hypothetical protein
MRLAGRVIGSLALVAAVTGVSFRLAPVNAITAGFLHLVTILLIATAGGLVESTIASIAAMLCFNYFFLPPVTTLAPSLYRSGFPNRAERQGYSRDYRGRPPVPPADCLCVDRSSDPCVCLLF